MTPSIYEGYAACEQYGIDGLNIGTYTDVYGLCATIFRALIGSVPPAAVQRIENDAMTIPAKFAEELPHPVLAALANGLQVLPKNRTQNIEEFKNELVYGEIQSPAVKEKTAPAKNAKVSKKKATKAKDAKYALISALCTVLAILLIGVILIFTVFKDSVFNNKDNSSVYSTPSFNAPVVDSIGTVDSGVEDNVKLYPVPELKGKYFSEIIDNDEYEMFEFVLKDKAYSDNCPKGTVCDQSVDTGTQSPRDTKIEVTISLGPKEFAIANLKGMDEDSAKLELLKQGFLYENIKVLEKYDEDSEPNTVIEQSPKYGEKVNSEAVVEIYINSFKGNNTTSN
jgi:serine/threonine-protein kinase